jgi:heme-degrading monooxygenase HmoA
MSVLMMLRVPVDAAAFERMAAEHADDLKGISERARGRGAIHHAFYEGDGEVIIVDEWETPEAFTTFFDDEAENIGPLMAAAGVGGAPGQPVFHRKLSTGDDF